MKLGYNTNGLAHHSLPAAIELLASLGYESVAITLDHRALDPFSPNFSTELNATRELLELQGLRSVVETGARYLLDPRRKHWPTLLSPNANDRQRRIDFLCRAIDAAQALGSDCVSLWSGSPEDDSPAASLMQRLGDGMKPLIEYAEKLEVVIGFEPEPGMFIDRMERFEQLSGILDSPRLKLTLDVGHLYCMGEPIVPAIRRWAGRLVNVHIEDMRRGVHEHLMFGEGEMDFPPIIAAFDEAGYTGGVHVELSRHSHVGPAAAQQAYEFLAPLMDASR